MIKRIERCRAALLLGYSATWKGEIVHPEGYLVEPFQAQNFYQFFSFSFAGRTYHAFVHRFVWTYWCGEIPKGLEIDHFDFRRDNNHMNNLDLITHAENIRRRKGQRQTWLKEQGIL